MRRAVVVTLFASLATLAAGCSDKDTKSPNGAGGQSAGGASEQNGGAGAGGVGAAGSATMAPPITSAPASWAPPADCNGVGDVCPNGIFDCSGMSVCQLEGNVCIPPGSDTGLKLQPRTMERPYCLAYQCMTYEEASCFCTGKAGKQFPTCSSPGAVAGLCTGEGSSCTKDKCCDGLTCIKQSSTVSTCQKTCTQASDCNTGCCSDQYGTGQTICAPEAECKCREAAASCVTKACCDGLTCVKESPTASVCAKACAQASDCDTGCCTDAHETGKTYCEPAIQCQKPCKKRGEACDSSSNDCCNGTCVFGSTNSDFNGCRPRCNTGPDCDTGCCIPFKSSPGGFCADAKYCTCGTDGASCGQNQPTCCDGTSCSSTGSEPSLCRKNCMTASDCPSGCCSAPFAGENYGVCFDTSACIAPP